ncbi:rhodanese-like domain-containing protein [Oleomonas cavernae]|uniref:Rhodanese-like domain-containing protein n=1 Tax=Oleomonas cavernae TaxID=2320859 RepID=A0A418WCG3_9PROT|nr:rhodanese-like domain-containing protein [Oleomonas cavernae]RJF87674.1 rhodanese-like domain-containing protein [Oleomonas cavernae]
MSEIELPVEALAARLEAGETPMILDVREPWEFEICHLDGAVNVPLGTLERGVDPAELADGRTVVVVCHHGARSLRATLWLRSKGVEGAINLTGGIDRWAGVVDPGMARY